MGEDCLSPELSFQAGGMGLNVAIALARIGMPARLVSCVGQDWFGDFALGRASSTRARSIQFVGETWKQMATPQEEIER